MGRRSLEENKKQEMKDRDATEKQRIAAYKQKVMESLRDKIKVRFQNIEAPGFNCEFTYEGLQSFNLLDGYEYDLPKVVANHLNNLTKPRYEWHEDPKTKLNKCIEVGRENRFSCIPTSM